MEQDRIKWDDRYRTATAAVELTVDPWFIEQVQGLQPGRALDVACGLGHDAVWLAKQGWEVTAVDISPVGLSHAAELAQSLGVTVDWIVGDLDEYVPPSASYELITVCRFLDRDRLPARLERALCPGGRLLYRTFCAGSNDTGHRNPRFVLQPGELPRLFSGLSPLLYDEVRSGPDQFARFVGCRRYSS
jgi:SAM-dependent methyltransferase